MKKYLFCLAALAAGAPAAVGWIVKIPSLEVNGETFPRSVYNKIMITPGIPGEQKNEPGLQVTGQNTVALALYSKIKITPGTPAKEETGPSLHVTGQNAVSRAVYNKIRIDEGGETYTLMSNDPMRNPNQTYSFAEAPQVSLGTKYTAAEAVPGTYTLMSNDPESPHLEYSMATAPKLALVTHKSMTPSEPAYFTLTPNDSQSEPMTLSFEGIPRVYLTTKEKTVTSVESVENEDDGLWLTYNSVAETLRVASAERVDVRVSNLGGQIVLRGRLDAGSRKISVNSLPAGVYIVTAHTSASAQTLKFIKH